MQVGQGKKERKEGRKGDGGNDDDAQDLLNAPPTLIRTWLSLISTHGSQVAVGCSVAEDRKEGTKVEEER